MYRVVYVVPYGHHLAGKDNNDLKDKRITYVQNLPEDHSHHDSLYMCGLEIAEFHSDEPLTSDQIMYAVSRIRTSAECTCFADTLVSIWKIRNKILVGILGKTFAYEYEKTDRVKFHEWLEKNVDALHKFIEEEKVK
jgi:hypothetical protein